jgi:hypothetical protein
MFVINSNEIRIGFFQNKEDAQHALIRYVPIGKVEEE